MGSISKLSLHRLEAISDGRGRIRLERVAEKPNKENLGVEYGIGIRQIDDKNARVLGWRSPDSGYLECDEGASGTVYAPKGFRVGEICFCKINDAMVTASTMDMSSVDSFLDSLGRAEAMHAAKILGKYTLVGEITLCY